MVNLITASPECRETAEGKFSNFIEKSDRRKDWLSYAVANGLLNATAIHIDGKPAYCVFWGFADDGRFCVDSAQALDPALSDFPLLVSAIEAMAKNAGATRIEFATRREGLVKQAASCGFAVHSLIMAKDIS